MAEMNAALETVAVELEGGAGAVVVAGSRTLHLPAGSDRSRHRVVLCSNFLSVEQTVLLLLRLKRLRSRKERENQAVTQNSHCNIKGSISLLIVDSELI